MVQEQSFTKTGKQIYEDLKKLDNEIKELYEAAQMVKSEIGAGSAAYRLLNEQYNEKRKEMQTKEKWQYAYRVFEPRTPVGTSNFGMYPEGAK